MTGLVANVAGLAAALGTVARDVSRFVAGVAALHVEAARVVSALWATASHVSGANVAGLAAALGTVARDVSRFVAGVAALHVEAARVVSALWATASHVSGFVAVVTAHLGSLLTVFCNMSNSVATVAEILVFFALTCKVSVLVALEALFTAPAKTSITITAVSSSATSCTTLGTLPGEVTHSVTLVTRARTHFLSFLVPLAQKR